MGLTKQEVEHVAQLARLELSEAEIEEYTGQLNQILSFVAKLDQLDTTGVEPMAHTIPVTNVFRPDKTGPSLDPEKVLANAPDRVGNFFKVPKILDH